MELRIYRIDRSLSGKVANWWKPPELPPMSGTVMLGNPFKNVRDVMQEKVYVLSKDDEIERFKDPRGNELVDDIYYIRHPKKTKTDCLIPADKFHSFIAREQIADIISYVRSNLNVLSLDLSISNEAAGKVVLSGDLSGLPLEGNAQFAKKDKYTATIKCTKPLKPSEKKKEFIWMDEFANTQSIVDDAESGTFSIRESFDLSFGMGAKDANRIGINLDWSCGYIFDFSVVVA